MNSSSARKNSLLLTIVPLPAAGLQASCATDLLLSVSEAVTMPPGSSSAGNSLAQSALDGDPRSLQALIALFTDIMAQTNASTAPCSVVTKIILFIFSVEDGRITIGRQLRKKHPNVLTACMRYIAHPRSRYEMQAQKQALFELSAGNCNCDMNDPLLAALHNYDLLKSLNLKNENLAVLQRITLAESMYTYVMESIESLGTPEAVQTVLRKLSKAARTRFQHAWPRCESDLVPFGAE